MSIDVVKSVWKDKDRNIVCFVLQSPNRDSIVFRSSYPGEEYEKWKAKVDDRLLMLVIPDHSNMTLKVIEEKKKTERKLKKQRQQFTSFRVVDIKTRLKQQLDQKFNLDWVYETPSPQEGIFNFSQLPYCARKLVFDHYLHWDYPEDNRIHQLGLLGMVWHKISQTLFRGKSITSEQFTLTYEHSGLFFKGRIDLQVLDILEAHYVIEIKTIGAQIQAPRPEHVQQLMLEMKGIQLTQEKTRKVKGILFYIPNFILIEEFLDPSNWSLFEFEFDEALFEELVAKAKMIRNLTLEGRLPTRNENWQCKTNSGECPYFELCNKNISELTDISGLVEKDIQ